MANWVRLGAASEIPEGQCRVYEAGGGSIAVFFVQGGYHAIDNTCVHRGGPLGEGTIEGTLVTCPWHHWQYDVTTGRARHAETIAVRAYTVELRSGDVYADIE